MSPEVPPTPDPDDRTRLSLGLRLSTGLVALALVLLGLLGMLTSRLSGSAPGPVPPAAIGVLALGLAFGAIAAVGRAPRWLPAREPKLLGQVVLTAGVVMLVAVGRGVAAVRDDTLGRVIGWGSLVLAAVLVLVALVRRWVPGFGDPPKRR